MLFKSIAVGFWGLLNAVLPVSASTFRQNVEYHVCFTPLEPCTAEIVNLIDSAKESIYVQAYSFTSHPIIKALLAAAKRGVHVSVILDKSNFDGRHYSPAQVFIDNGIPVWNDASPDIAHNKVMIIDRTIVETGSFNYTNAAQKYNTENVVIIYDRLFAGKYLLNWDNRKSLSSCEGGGCEIK